MARFFISAVPFPRFVYGKTLAVSGRFSVCSVACAAGLKKAYQASGNVLRTLTRIVRGSVGLSALRTLPAAGSPPSRAV